MAFSRSSHLFPFTQDYGLYSKRLMVNKGYITPSSTEMLLI